MIRKNKSLLDNGNKVKRKHKFLEFILNLMLKIQEYFLKDLPTPLKWDNLQILLLNINLF